MCECKTSHKWGMKKQFTTSEWDDDCRWNLSLTVAVVFGPYRTFTVIFPCLHFWPKCWISLRLFEFKIDCQKLKYEFYIKIVFVENSYLLYRVQISIVTYEGGLIVVIGYLLWNISIIVFTIIKFFRYMYA